MSRSPVFGLWGGLALLSVVSGVWAVEPAASAERGLLTGAEFSALEMVSYTTAPANGLLFSDEVRFGVVAADEGFPSGAATRVGDEWDGIDWSQNPFVGKQEMAKITMWGDMSFQFLGETPAAVTGHMPRALGAESGHAEAWRAPDALVAAVLALIGLVAVARRRPEPY